MEISGKYFYCKLQNKIFESSYETVSYHCKLRVAKLLSDALNGIPVSEYKNLLIYSDKKEVLELLYGK